MGIFSFTGEVLEVTNQKGLKVFHLVFGSRGPVAVKHGMRLLGTRRGSGIASSHLGTGRDRSHLLAKRYVVIHWAFLLVWTQSVGMIE